MDDPRNSCHRVAQEGTVPRDAVHYRDRLGAEYDTRDAAPDLLVTVHTLMLAGGYIDHPAEPVPALSLQNALEQVPTHLRHSLDDNLLRDLTNAVHLVYQEYTRPHHSGELHCVGSGVPRVYP